MDTTRTCRLLATTTPLHLQQILLNTVWES